MHNGKIVEETVRMPVSGQSVVIDALNFVVDGGTYDKELKEKLNNPLLTEKDKELIAYDTASEVAFVLGMMFGERYTEIEYTGKGANFYRYAYRIGDYNQPLGLICLGHAKSDTVLIMLYGAGCHCMPDCWEGMLYGYLTQLTINPRITRVDLALDDFDGLYSSAQLADEADTHDKFCLTNKKPQVQHLGDWKRHTGKGRTLQVGTREGGKLYRGYEKGKQLGDSESFWFRHEVELSNKNRLIPLEVLTNPTSVFKGCYPYCAELLELAGNVNVKKTRIELIKKESKISFDKSKQIVKHQFGKYLRVYRDFFTDTEILDMLVSDKKGYYPKRLKTLETVRHDMPIIMRRYFDEQNQSTDDYLLDIPFGDDVITLKHIPQRGIAETRQPTF